MLFTKVSKSYYRGSNFVDNLSAKPGGKYLNKERTSAAMTVEIISIC